MGKGQEWICTAMGRDGNATVQILTKQKKALHETFQETFHTNKRLSIETFKAFHIASLMLL